MASGHHLSGKTAIITGSGRGIGRAIARRMAAHGANVVITSRTPDQLDETRRLIERGGGGRVLALAADVTEASDVEEVVAKTVEVFGPVQILVNNVGTAPIARIEDMEPEQFDRAVQGNIRSVYLCTRAVWRTMRENGGGAIVNIASLAAYDPFPGFSVYGASKAFVVAFTKSLAREGAAEGIRLHCVAPGAVETQMLRGAFPDFPTEKALEPDDIAAMVETVLSPVYRYSSGQTVPVVRV